LKYFKNCEIFYTNKGKLLIVAFQSILWVIKVKHVRRLKMKLVPRVINGPNQIHLMGKKN